MKKILLSFVLLFGLSSIVYGADQWDKTKFADDTLIPAAPGLMRVNNEAIDRILVDYQESSDVFYSSSTEVIVSAGSVSCSNSGGTVRKLRTTTSSTTVGWANIDTGAEANSTTYYVYAVADTDATTFTIEISISSSAPTGATYYKKLGSFYNNSSGNIDNFKVYANAYAHTPTDANGIPKVSAIYSYGTSASSYTLKQSDLKVAYGELTIAGSSCTTVSNLAFTSTSTYSCTASHNIVSIPTGNANCKEDNGTSLRVCNGDSASQSVNWMAIGY